ncbi:Uma2 family endonuclease [Microcoleus sp. FACHB-1515]|uniref:Uma2 family endonuclease n=1 Tax=Cyanophyceae TaxID=3028117 RepID=UPI00168217A6|nr:Uma2 family endonuclease [Microcoleus sp. FACHB-1515]MBD2090499.1 Uma2 family endonuclease [Microcoleus sp. FACHB-1515]
MVTFVPIETVEYPDEDGKPMAEGDAQRKALTYCTETLSLYFRSRRPDVYVAGNLFIYYEQGNPASVIAPDVFVVFGVNGDDRRSYKTWEEGDRTPDFVLEITSKSTRTQDQGAKKGIYAFLGVQEYFQYDPTGDYLQPVLQGMRLQDGNYFAIEPTSENPLTLHSETLQLDLRIEAGKLRFYNPATGEKLLAYAELEQARQEAEAARQEAEQAKRAAEQRANQEAIARQAIESRMAELEAELRRLQAGNS